MTSLKSRAIYTSGNGEPTYLDIQATVGITKHFGGYAATDALHRLCHVAEAHEVLDVGCGIGIGPAYVAKRYNCHVTAVDLSQKMLSWAEKRARREGVLERISFRKADIRALPFEDDRFDAVLVESVLAFVDDKEATVRELLRVTRPGGYVGLNESCWIQQPPPDILAQSQSLGTAIATEAEWRALWEVLPFAERAIQIQAVEAKQEIRDRIEWIGWRSILPAWGRVIKMMVTNPRSRDAIREQFASPTAVMGSFGYGLFVGRKPAGHVEASLGQEGSANG